MQAPEEDEMALVKSFLAESQNLKKAHAPADNEEEMKDMCLLCEREFIVGGKVHV